jgi:hypothetical protein
MSEKIRITKDGLKTWRWDYDLRKQCRIKKNDYGYCVEKDGVILHQAPSKEEANEFFWAQETIVSPWTYLRHNVSIDDDINAGDIRKIIRKYEEFEILCNLLWPTWDTYPNSDSKVSVCRVGNITNGDLTFHCLNSDNNKETMCIWQQDVVLSVLQEEKILVDEPYCLSLLEVLSGLFINPVVPFDNNSFLIPALHEVNLTKEGLRKENPLKYLLHPVKVDKDVTVGDIFRWVAQNEELKSFISMYSWCQEIDAFHEEAANPQESAWHAKIHYAEVYRSLEVHVGERHSIDEGLNFHGVGEILEDTLKFYERTNSPAPSTDRYSLSGSSVGTYSHLPLRVEEMVEIQQMPIYSRKGGCKQPLKILAKVRCPWTLLEILDAIYWDISFYGSPSQRDGEMKVLQDRLENFDSKKSTSLEELLDRSFSSFSKQKPPDELI